MRALQALDAVSEDRQLIVSVAKSKVGRVAQLATQEAIQMHGGIGMTDEFNIGFFLKRVASLKRCMVMRIFMPISLPAYEIIRRNHGLREQGGCDYRRCRGIGLAMAQAFILAVHESHWRIWMGQRLRLKPSVAWE
ncbi:MAG: hypothetical protein Ct9H300mP16_12800 [Pseudomonadota bacterium]|nr:MAG: hypothetical protein Ct9H300mP16_12800 [Pseudomonadota bacterium]